MAATSNDPSLGGSQDISIESDVPSEANFAFLVHSQDSLSNSTPPSVDDHRLARQKRKRTSPVDHAILEAEFKLNPKPDKLARQQIVQHVALGEKEVQVRGSSNQEDTFSESCSSVLHVLSSQQDPSSQSSMTQLDQNNTEIGVIAAMNDDEQLLSQGNEIDAFPSAQNTKESEGITQTFKLDSSGTMRPRDSADILKSQSPSKRRPGSYANRRSASFIIHDDHSLPLNREPRSSLNSSQECPKSQSAVQKAQGLRRTSSLMKLSTDEDGKALLMPRTGETPSPPRANASLTAQLRRSRGPGLLRSFSAVDPVGSLSVSDVLPGLKSRRQTHGRSRDARTWEFYCDDQAQDALSKQAEREESGSATAVIGLMRSNSSKRLTLKSNANKRNATIQKNEAAKRHKTENEKMSKPKLERSISSVAKLQTTSSNIQKQRNDKPAPKHSKSYSQPYILEDLDGDSDKENWVPGTQQRPPPPRRRPVTDQETARTLLESLREPSQSSSGSSLFGGGNSRRHSSATKVSNRENRTPEVDDDVAVFMGGSSLPREEEDLDCVQNLLSLSQAAWC
ncbi:uncharacterized protein KY384_008243 [Bacidia gigantensis]|uniref:uncharacterized protein n=1 Tax=Bacidia gigantensis TaxID=2732470 RepID=UPI001D04B805|nr:uncharacterized protein KY384_008243 [Bacidia gigantensis]KAG8526814.1 hypothetical protein KY384_008243 [Bacidia gigantensis]